MAHFAKVIGGIVQQVIVADQEFINSGLVGEPFDWVQTSYNTYGGVHYEPNSYDVPSKDQTKALRKNFACIGDIYDVQRDAFYKPQPYTSWVLNEESCIWEAPVAFPTALTYDKEGIIKKYIIEWDELNIRWINNLSQYWDHNNLLWVNI